MFGIAAAFGGAAGGIALDQKDLALGGVGVPAVDQLAGQARPFERVLAAREVAGFLGRFARALRLHALVDDRARLLRILFEEKLERSLTRP